MTRTQKNQLPHGVFVVEDESDKAVWTRIGAAWPHEDSKGLNIQPSCMPLDGLLIIREPKPVKKADAEAGQ